MKIALIAPGFSAGEEDWCIPALLDLVRLLARVHEVHVFALRYPHRSAVYPVYEATVHAFGGAARGGSYRLHLLTRALAAIRQEHRRGAFDVFHGLWADEPGFLAVTAGRLLGAPAVVSVLGGELVGFADIGYGGLLSRSNRWLAARALHRADRVTVGSATLWTVAQRWAPEEKLAIQALGVDTAVFSPGPKQGAPGFHLLHVASFSAVKDQGTLLRAVARVASQAPEVVLHVAGDGALRDRLVAQAAALGLSTQVVFHGEVPHHHLPDFYRMADLFVLSSRYESQSLVVLEAGACGCPVVGTAVGLLPELLDPEAVAPAGDDAALAEAMLRLIRSPERRVEAGRSLQRRVIERYSLETTAAAWSDLYAGVCGGEGRYHSE